VGLQVRSFEGGAVQFEAAGGGQQKTAAALPPRPGQGGQQGNGADGFPAAFAALDTVVEPDGGRTGGGVVTGQLFDLRRGMPVNCAARSGG
jgi:hypothetical protein